MIQLLSKLPHESRIKVAVSGGVDSMVAYKFLEKGGHKPFPIFVHHGTEASDKALEFFNKEFSGNKAIHYIRGERPKGKSLEEWWRDERMKFFREQFGPVITGHHLDDAVETYLWSSLHGQAKVINYYNGVVYRPFLITPKAELIRWALENNVNWIEDESNEDVGFQRNRIRHNILPEALKINPGLHKVVKKIIIRKIKEK